MGSNLSINLRSLKGLNRKEWVQLFFVSFLLICLVIVGIENGINLRSGFADNSLLFGILVPYFLSRKSRKADIGRLLRTLLTNYNFEKLVTHDLASWAYFVGNVVFWTINIRNFAYFPFSNLFFTSLGVSLALLLMFRLVLESFVSILSIALNKSGGSITKTSF